MNILQKYKFLFLIGLSIGTVYCMEEAFNEQSASLPGDLTCEHDTQSRQAHDKGQSLITLDPESLALSVKNMQAQNFSPQDWVSNFPEYSFEFVSGRRSIPPRIRRGYLVESAVAGYAIAYESVQTRGMTEEQIQEIERDNKDLEKEVTERWNEWYSRCNTQPQKKSKKNTEELGR